MGVPFTTKEKEQVLFYLNYPDWVKLAQSIQLGIPQGSQPLFLVQGAFDRISPDARDTARRCLCECEAIHCQMSEARGRLKAIQVGEIKLNPNELSMLKTELMYWTTRLADVLGVIPDPYSQMMYQGIGDIGGRNARVVS